MTRIVFFVLAGVFLLFISPGKAPAEEAIAIFRPGSDVYTTRGKSLQMDKKTLLVNSRLYVPLRFFALGTGADERSFFWNEDASKVALIQGNNLLLLDMQKGAVNINGGQLPMGPKPVVIDGRIYVPLRHFAEASGYKVVWDEQNMNACIFPGEPSNSRQNTLRHEFAVDRFRFAPGEITLEQWNIALIENNIRLTMESVEKMTGRLNETGQTFLSYEKMIGDAIIDLPGDPGQSANNRNANVSLNYLNGVMLPQGETFSFNSAAGPYTEERGYTTGFAFSGNKVINSMGGGVCRTSTLVYIAGLNAGLPVVERHRHSLPVDYAPRNKDAAVWYGVLDLRFKNGREHPLVLKTAGDKNRIYLSIWEQHR